MDHGAWAMRVAGMEAALTLQGWEAMGSVVMQHPCPNHTRFLS